MSKTFKTADMIAQGKLHPESSPFFYIYCQHYKSHISYGIVAEISIEVLPSSFRIITTIR